MTSKKELNTLYIMSKGRPQCLTARALKQYEYPGEWYIVCGNNDETIEQYIKNYGENKVLVFDWYEEVKHTDLMDNFGYEKKASGAAPARNAIAKISKERGELRHWQFDDDYTHFRMYDHVAKKMRKPTGAELEERMFRIAKFGHNLGLNNVGFQITNCTFLQSWSQLAKRVYNAHNMPSFTDDFMKWRGRMNDDTVNAIDIYTNGGREYTCNLLGIYMKETQSESGGLTEMYREDGTVRKTAYAILAHPGINKLCVKFGRYHHDTKWKNIAPMIVSDKYKKHLKSS